MCSSDLALAVPGAPEGTLPGGPGVRVLDAGTAYVMIDMMRNVFYAGTAKKGQREGMDFGGKTGTTSNFIDAWFVGYSPRYTVAVWVGTDGTQSIGDKETGGKAALPVWSRIMAALPNVPGERFAVPDDVVLLPAEERWLGFVRGTAPTDLLHTPTLEAGAPLPAFGLSYPAAQAPEAPPVEAQPVAMAPIVDDGAPTGDVEAGAGDPEVASPEVEPGAGITEER